MLVNEFKDNGKNIKQDDLNHCMLQVLINQHFQWLLLIYLNVRL